MKSDPSSGQNTGGQWRCGMNSYTSSGNETPQANSTSVKALESHRVNNFYLKRIRLNLELCLADRWEPMDPAGPRRAVSGTRSRAPAGGGSLGASLGRVLFQGHNGLQATETPAWAVHFVLIV